MLVNIQKTNATLARRRELQQKIAELLWEYSDVPIMVMHRCNVSSTEAPIIDFGPLPYQYHILSHNNFYYVTPKKRAKPKGEDLLHGV